MPTTQKNTGPTDENVSWSEHITNSAGYSGWNYATRVGKRDFTGTTCTTCPSYWFKKNRGNIIPYQPFTQQVFSYEANGLLTARQTHKGNGSWTQWDYVNNVPADPPDVNAQLVSTASLLNDMDFHYLVNKAAADIMSGGWDVLTFLVELKKTREMFISLVTKFKALNQRLELYMKGKEALSVVDWVNLANLWLEGRYGWRTLIYDLEDLDKAVKSLTNGKHYDRQRKTREISTITSPTTVTTVVNGIIQTTTTKSETISLSGNGKVIGDLEVAALQWNAAATAWELFRFSFVIDWLIGVGNALQVNTFLATARDYSASYGGQVLWTRNIVQAHGPIDDDATYSYTASGLTNLTYETEYRVRVPTTLDRLPQVELKISALKIVDLVALLIQFAYRASGGR